ncbi:glutathionylspermidine synthase family protein [Paenibacillus lutrae]|uniref:Glutathionylspermidine synthase n=1 Tax=Paenibacillus lutrae TaxID=2078573 RepID=A0A7X3FFY8_9BACL|nr:glutathionylspermidine synthase family protein [Paenibacillus lutrae]MVO98976.1 glutathionylspermidine synthase [Paenibacillus lutrae]
MNNRAFRVVGQPLEDRKARVAELAGMGFTWADIGAEEYWIDQLVVMNGEVYEDVKQASRMLWSVFDKGARFVFGRRDLYEMLSIPEVLWDGLDQLEPGPPGLISRYARFDFSVSEDGRVKLLELNADTPTGYVESSIVTPWMSRQYGYCSPNAVMGELVRQAWSVEQPEAAACIDYGKHLEDSGTIDALVKHSGRQMRCVDCLDLWVDEGILKDSDNRAISGMFALYPKEWMGVDDGGEALAYAIETGRLNLFNPIHAIILQSKGLQAVIWGLHEMGVQLFTREEHEAIERYMLPTYNQPVFEGSYVSKSMFGREGGSVRMYASSGDMDIQDEEGFDTSTLFENVYQERADLPRVQLAQGEYRLLTGMFVINGEPCGLLGRAGGLITGNASHFVAIGVDQIE